MENADKQVSCPVDSPSGSRPLVPPKPGEGGLVSPKPGEGGSAFDSRRNWPIFAFAFFFASCLIGAYAWFNTDIVRLTSESLRAFSPKTLWAGGLLHGGLVGSVLTARCGDARTSPPRPRPKSLAAGSRPILKQALTRRRLPQPAASAEGLTSSVGL